MADRWGRVADEDVPYVVGDHSRRIREIEEETKDLNVLRHEIKQLTQALNRCNDNLSKTRDYVDEEVSKLKNAVVVAAISLAGSAILVSATVYLAVA